MIGGRFELECALTPDGSLHRARDVERGVLVLLRICDLSVEKSFERLDRFEREVELLRGLRHPQIPAFIASGQDEARAYLALEDVDGVTLEEELGARRYHETEVLDVLADVLPILTYLHELSPPVVHRDLTPRSIVRRRADGRLFLRDLGSAIASKPSSVELTSSGTYGYLAPELLRGGASSAASDLYALGVIAVRLLTREDPDEMLVDGQLDWQSHVDAHPSTRSILRDLLAADPAQRASSARSVRERVERVRLLVLEATKPTHRREEEAATELDLPSNALLKARAPALAKNGPFGGQPTIPLESHRELDDLGLRLKKLIFMGIVLAGVGLLFWLRS